MLGKLPGFAAERHLSLLQQEEVIGHLQRHMCVLLDQKDRSAVRVQIADDPKDLLDDQGCQAERRLVHHQEPGPRHHGAGHGQHLLLAAG